MRVDQSASTSYSLTSRNIQGSCHSNCEDISCSGAVCTITYKGTNPMEMFNIKKVVDTGENDR